MVDGADVRDGVPVRHCMMLQGTSRCCMSGTSLIISCFKLHAPSVTCLSPDLNLKESHIVQWPPRTIGSNVAPSKVALHAAHGAERRAA